MKLYPLQCLLLVLITSPIRADYITINGFNNNTQATVHFNDGSGLPGHSGTSTMLVAQYSVTYSSLAPPVTFNTFSIDLFHSASLGQTYLVNPRNDLGSAFTNGSRIAYIYQQYGMQNLSNDSVQAAALQISLWDLSLNNHNPTFFSMDMGGTYSSGDQDVFSISLASNPQASQIASLTNQFLTASIGATTQGAWLDATPAGDDPNRGQSLLSPMPEPPAIVTSVIAIGCLILARRLREYLASS